MRRAIAYLRWEEGDADAIAPSLCAGPGGRGKVVSAAASEPPAGPGQNVPASSSGAREADKPNENTLPGTGPMLVPNQS